MKKNRQMIKIPFRSLKFKNRWNLKKYSCATPKNSMSQVQNIDVFDGQNNCHLRLRKIARNKLFNKLFLVRPSILEMKPFLLQRRCSLTHSITIHHWIRPIVLHLLRNTIPMIWSLGALTKVLQTVLQWRISTSMLHDRPQLISYHSWTQPIFKAIKWRSLEKDNHHWELRSSFHHKDHQTNWNSLSYPPSNHHKTINSTNQSRPNYTKALIKLSSKENVWSFEVMKQNSLKRKIKWWVPIRTKAELKRSIVSIQFFFRLVFENKT